MIKSRPVARRLSNKTAVVFIALTVCAVYGRLSVADFTIWDDPHTLRDNPAMRPPTMAHVVGYWQPIRAQRLAEGDVINHQAHLWVPLTYTVWSAIASAAQVRGGTGQLELNPYLFHLVNIALHTASATFVFFIARRLMQSSWPALAAALLFAVHPIQVEAVGWTSGLKDLLAGALSLLAMLFYTLHTDESAVMRQRRIAWWSGLAAFALALLAKPSAVTVPLILFVIDWLLIRRDAHSAARSLVPWLLVALPAALIARAAQSGADVEPVAIHLRPLVAGDALAFYLGKLIWPARLCIDYGRTPQQIWQSGAIGWTWIIPALLLLTCAAAWSYRPSCKPWLLAALLIFAIAPLPVLGLVPFSFQNYSTTADHYLYLAMLGPAILFGAIFKYFDGRAMRWTAGILLVVLSGRSVAQSLSWLSSESLFMHTLRANPNSVAGLNNMGSVLSETGDWPGAAVYFRRAMAVNPDRWQTYMNLRQVLTVTGQYDEALDVLRRECRQRSSASVAQVGHAWLRKNFPAMQAVARGRYADAISQLQNLQQIGPPDADVVSLLVLAEALQARAAPASAPSSKG